MLGWLVAGVCLLLPAPSAGCVIDGRGYSGRLGMQALWFGGRSGAVCWEKAVDIRCDICGKLADETKATQLDANAIYWGCPTCVPSGTMMMPCTKCRRFVTLPVDYWDTFLNGPMCEDCAEEDD